MVRSQYGEFEIDVLQDRENTFEPQLVKKDKKTFQVSNKKYFLCMLEGY